jgi:hypothetical protein
MAPTKCRLSRYFWAVARRPDGCNRTKKTWSISQIDAGEHYILVTITSLQTHHGSFNGWYKRRLPRQSSERNNAKAPLDSAFPSASA